MSRPWLHDGDPGNCAPPLLVSFAAALLALPWRSIFHWLVILALAFCVAVAMLAAFQPLYDLMKGNAL